MTTWFLVLLILTPSRTAMTSMEFNSKKSCEEAAARLKETADKLYRGNLVTQCVKNKSVEDDY